ncbi:MAG: flagellar hook-basal body complex protein FliE [Gammaproteobacteria bacterium]
MTVEAIAAAGVVMPTDSLDAAAVSPDVTGTAFDTLMQGIESLNTRLQAGQAATSQLALGQADNLHRIMIDSEQTRLTFELMLAVRNKALEAYQELMRMQV